MQLLGKDLLFIGPLKECKLIAQALGLPQASLKIASCIQDLYGLRASTTLILVETWYYRFKGDRDEAREHFNMHRERGGHIIMMEYPV